MLSATPSRAAEVDCSHSSPTTVVAAGIAVVRLVLVVAVDDHCRLAMDRPPTT